jgi:hypothetical protein
MVSNQIIVMALLLSLLSSGCSVIKPDLLIDSSGPAQDATAQDATADDAYTPAVGNLISNSGFEVEGTTGWTTNGDGTIALSTATAHTGTHSLSMSARGGEWNGPAVVLTASVRPGRHYTMSAFVRRAAAGSDEYGLSIRHTCGEDGRHFNEQVTRTLVVASDNATWVQPSSSFVVINDRICTLAEVMIYVETTIGNASFFIDDLEVNEVFP